MAEHRHMTKAEERKVRVKAQSEGILAGLKIAQTIVEEAIRNWEENL